jgi:hypothetical protein
MLDQVFKTIFARFRRELGDSHLEFVWRRATGVVSGMVVLPLAAVAIIVIAVVSGLTKTGSPASRMHLGELIGIVEVVGALVLLRVHFRKFLVFPPKLPEVESSADARRVLWFRVFSVAIFVLVCLMGLVLRKAGFQFIQGI